MKAFWGLLLLTACGGGTGEPFVAAGSACMPNDTKECACPAGAKGAQACKDDGSGWDKCQCHEEVTPTSDAGSDSPDPTQCVGQCSAATYDGQCETGCILMFQGKCQGACGGRCDGMDANNMFCRGTCQGTCIGGTAIGHCESKCDGAFTGTCTGVCTR